MIDVKSGQVVVTPPSKLSTSVFAIPNLDIDCVTCGGAAVSGSSKFEMYNKSSLGVSCAYLDRPNAMPCYAEI